VVGGRVESLEEGMGIAKESIESVSTYNKLKELIMASDGDISKLEEILI
jgi:anthranilate phosphoribosyltransferase